MAEPGSQAGAGGSEPYRHIVLSNRLAHYTPRTVPQQPPSACIAMATPAHTIPDSVRAIRAAAAQAEFSYGGTTKVAAASGLPVRQSLRAGAQRDN